VRLFCLTSLVENNLISTLVIPQTFFTHLSKELDKGERGKSGEHKSISRSSSASSSISTAPSKADSRSDVRKGRGGRGGRGGGGRGGDKDSEEKSDKDSAALPMGLPSLTELYLSGNRITTLKGFEAYGTVETN
jgi:Leucine-rich repeat (LRR) protein